MSDLKKTGIWIDSKNAIIVSFLNGDKSVDIVESGIEGHERVEGETDQKGRFGDQFVDSERKDERRKEHEIDNYLHEVIGYLKESDALAIFGPADMKTRLMKELEEYPDIRNRVRSVQAVDSLTKNQVVALVKTHYNL